MALNFKSIDYDRERFLIRLDSKYYYLDDTLSDFAKKNKEDIIDFGTIIDKITDGEHAGQTFVKEGVLFLKNSSIKDFDISKNDGFYISEEKHKLLSRSALKAEDILFTTIGHLGSAAIVPQNFGEANMNQNFVKITLKENTISPYYVVCYLNSKIARRQVNSLFTGNIQSILTYPKIKSLKIIRPKDRNIEKEIENKYKKALEYDEKAHNIINSITKELEQMIKFPKSKEKKIYSIENSEISLTSILWTPKFHYPLYLETEKYLIDNFDTISLGKVCDFKKGNEPGSEFYIDYLDKKDTDVPFIRTSDLYNYQIDLVPDNFIDIHTYEDLSQNVIPNDILYTKDGKIGELALVTESDKAIFGSGIERIRINKEGIKKGLTPEYIFTMLKMDEVGRYNADRYSVTASTIPHMREEYIQKIIIPILDKESINKITEKIKEAFEMIEEKKKLFKECQSTINSILSI